ncbi:MAG: glycogen/starch synthase, partial [Trueperaceae bacterium]
MRVLFAASEVAPFSKTGGLADVAGALPRALAARGHEMLVVTPWYADLGGHAAPLWIGDVPVPFDGGIEEVGVGTLEAHGVRYVFVGHPDFRRDGLYGHPDDLRRFCRFVRAIPPAAERVGFAPELVHAHDWHAAYLPLVLTHGWDLPDGWRDLPSLLTIHNLQHQGVSDLASAIHWLRLPESVRASGIDHFGSANAMQAGLDFAWGVTTVSPSYAREIQQVPYGHGLDGTLRHVAHKLTGILNGLEMEAWDPATDAALPVRYDADTADAGKAAAAATVRGALHLEPGRPIVGSVGRLADQKGVDLLLDAVPDLLTQGWNLALLGSGDPALEARALEVAQQHPGRIGVRIGYDDGLARRIYAAATAFLIPSRFEPCGLTQLIAMRY